MQYYVKIKCDICGEEELIPYKREEVLYKGQWKDFVLGDLYEMQMENRSPSNLCPQCAKRIGRFVLSMQNEFKKAGERT